jgi:hypothetical protein
VKGKILKYSTPVATGKLKRSKTKINEHVKHNGEIAKRTKLSKSNRKRWEINEDLINVVAIPAPVAFSFQYLKKRYFVLLIAHT